MELEKQLPYLKKKFLFAGDFAKASLGDIIEPAKLKEAELLTADDFTSGYLINKGNWQFEWRAFSWEVQLSPFRSTELTDVNSDGWMDLLVGSNFYANSIQMGRNDAGMAAVLLNQNGNGFRYLPWTTTITGEIRKFAPIEVNKEQLMLTVRNNDSLRLFRVHGLNQK
jgi:hypothetical protein